MARAAACRSNANMNLGCCLSLETITTSFSAPITEEHAFAIIYECMRTLGNVVAGAATRSTGNKGIAVVSGTADIMLHKEGRVHEATFVENLDSGAEEFKSATGECRVALTTEDKKKKTTEASYILYLLKTCTVFAAWSISTGLQATVGECGA
jgi:hypothetical protein